MDKNQSQDYINGIHCDVKNCKYHDPDCKCSAEHIVVGPTYASSNEETVCSTFDRK